MSEQDICIGPNSCHYCGGDYGEHTEGCKRPRREQPQELSRGDLLNVSVAASKYTVIQNADGKLHALRYGELWRDCVGDNLILALAQELETTRKLYNELLFAVASKFSNETRHQTALRYINEREAAFNKSNESQEGESM